MRTLDDVDVKDRRVLLRVDFNVPINEKGEIADDTRIVASLPTIKELISKGARIIIVSHLGRPKDREPEFSLRPVAKHLSELLTAPVEFIDHVVGEDVIAESKSLTSGDVLVLENLRFEPGEKRNDSAFAQQLAKLADVYINDAFGAAHRAHASTEGVVHFVQESAAGRLLEQEITVLQKLLNDPKRPLVAIIGGAKVTDKIGVIETFLSLADTLLIGTAMCFPFLKVQGHTVGNSLCEPEGVHPASAALKQDGEGKLIFPSDLVIADRFAADADIRRIETVDVPDNWMGLDIGEKTSKQFSRYIENAGTVFWNGPMGVFELEPFSFGTRKIAEAVASTSATTVVGGGDSVAALTQFGLSNHVDHISTGGGAALELIEGKKLPGVQALR